MGNWHHLISRVEVNENGVASLWIKEKKQIFFARAEVLGRFKVVGCESIIRKLQSAGLWWSDDIWNN